jgi:hypothetical protein
MNVRRADSQDLMTRFSLGAESFLVWDPSMFYECPGCLGRFHHRQDHEHHEDLCPHCRQLLTWDERFVATTSRSITRGLPERCRHTLHLRSGAKVPKRLSST